ncbi:endospore germination permease [Paenibacillus sp. HN-1]|uniref:GerAB/ArcD/ProY family transporter n=1 Tax=Paenibacillus TaxID=44249 RepID=UPI001CA9481F|nr:MULTISPECIES: endospore germination permease [Paenibacillus]MBY9079175.1 endospore germination permease [Paenibacillus sp. CGMCC 1.18879]MBY9087338.1 endospore germination permease [Paenibacillus sinensis]
MKMKLSGIQAFWIIMIMNLGMTLVVTVTPSLQAAKQDAWISIIAAGCIAMLIALLVTQVAQLYPNQTLIESCQTILGAWLGKVIIFIYLVEWYTITPIILHQFTDVVQIMLLHRTPKEAIMLLMICLIVYVTYVGGIEGIGRCGEFLGPIILLMVALVLIANITNVNVKNLLPVYADSGLTRILGGSLAPASYLGHSIEYLMFASFLNETRKGTPYVFSAVLTAFTMVLLTTMMIIVTIGTNLSPDIWYPFIEMAKKISLFGFIDNIDAVPIVIWITSVFIKLAVYLFIMSYGTAQFLNVRNWRKMIWLVAPVIFIFALIPQDVTQASTHYLQKYLVPIALPVNMLGLPLLLLIVGKLRQRKNPASAAPADNA